MDNVFSIANMGIVKALIKLAETRVMTHEEKVRFHDCLETVIQSYGTLHHNHKAYAEAQFIKGNTLMGEYPNLIDMMPNTNIKKTLPSQYPNKPEAQ